jgi:predicted Rossmann fold flavoprotein
MPPKLIPVCLDQTGLAGDKPAHQVSSEERRRLRVWLKEMRFTVTGHRPLREAIVTAGGVSLAEVNPKTMQSRVCPGLYLAGEVLDMDADTGGFNLQAALSTGHLAGLSAATAP